MKFNRDYKEFLGVYSGNTRKFEGYKAEISLEEGIKITFDWYKQEGLL